MLFQWIGRPAAFTSGSMPASVRLRRASRARAAALDATDRKPATSAEAPSNTSGHQKWNGTAASLNADADQDEQRAEHQDRIEHHRRRSGRVHGADKADGQVRQVAGAELAGQQADAVEHHARAPPP